MSNATPSTSAAGPDRELVISREFTAPRDLVWEAMTDPKHVVNWWGPRGFSTTIETMDLRPGGVWKQTLHGPDGANYPNKSVFQEVVRPERIVYSHGGGREGGPGTSFVATWTFDDLGGGRTRVTIRMVFPTAADRERVIREFGAQEGGRQTLERLSEHLAARRSQPFVITREFAAPRALVWQAWTERDRLMQWFGPKGFKMPLAKLDFRPGGMFHYHITGPNGAKVWGRFVYREIVPPSKLVWVNSFSDPAGGITRHPFTTDPWPLQLLTVVTFAERAGKTTVTLNWWPLDATDEEICGFEAKRESMQGGWGGTLEQLGNYLAAPTP
ncbi:MAG: SRPBCC family protein [Verrucomicrobia bacterium]|nr:SRPBCC family protein [Verrucomicrobiota bacterium]